MLCKKLKSAILVSCNSKECQLQRKSCPCSLYFNLLFAGHFFSFNQNKNWIPSKCAKIISKDEFTQLRMFWWVTKCFIFTPISSFSENLYQTHILKIMSDEHHQLPRFYSWEAVCLLMSFCEIEGQYFSEIQNNQETEHIFMNGSTRFG